MKRILLTSIRTALGKALPSATALAVLLSVVLAGCDSTTDATRETFSVLAVRGTVSSPSGGPVAASIEAEVTFENAPTATFGPASFGMTRSDGSFAGDITLPLSPGTRARLTVRARPQNPLYQVAETHALAEFGESLKVDTVVVQLVVRPL